MTLVVQLILSYLLSHSNPVKEEGGVYLPPLTDMVIRVLTVSVNNVSADGSFEMFLIRN